MVPPEAASFAREVVAAARPTSKARAKALLYAASRAGAFALSRGLELRAELVLCPSVVEPTPARRMRASALICLGAGAGLVGAHLRGLRGADVTCRSGGVVAVVRGQRPRVVPVLARYHARLLEAAAFAGEGLIAGRPGRNVTSGLVASLAGGQDLPRLEPGRLRATWLAEVARLVGLRAFMDAAGVVCSQRLGDIVAGLPALGEGSAVTLLGGAPC